MNDGGSTKNSKRMSHTFGFTKPLYAEDRYFVGCSATGGKS
jgi:hypothetical protein